MAGEVEYDLHSPHPGWQSLARVFGSSAELFQRMLFLQGYEFSSNIYLLTGPTLTLIDSGNDYTAFGELAKLDFKFAAISKIVLTHGHHDHAMGVFELLRCYRPGQLQFELVMHAAGPRAFKEVLVNFGCRITEVYGGERIELGGFDWEVINTPGHTVDGICLYHAPTRTVFTGDTVLPHAMAEPDRTAGGRLDHYLEALKELLQKDIEVVLPGHGVPVPAPYGRRVIEETYEALLMKLIGAEEKTPWMTGAIALAERGLFGDAVYCCDRELACDPENARALQLKALCLNDLGRFADALAVIEDWTARDPQRSREVYVAVAKGYALMGLGRYDESIVLFDQAMGLDPGCKDAQVYKGMALYLSGNYDQAMEIDAFKSEFINRFKSELNKITRAQA